VSQCMQKLKGGKSIGENLLSDQVMRLQCLSINFIPCEILHLFFVTDIFVVHFRDANL
jgi:hypothetical protein